MKFVKILFITVIISLLMVSCKDENENSTTLQNDFTETTTQMIVPLPEETSDEITTQAEQMPVNNNSGDRVFYGKVDNDLNTNTYTGLFPLSLVDFKYSHNAGFIEKSKNMISHSYGVAKNETPHTISIDFQKFFDENSFDAVCLDNKSEKKVLYLTFDCGYENGYTSKILDTLKEKNVKAAFFCTLPQMRDNPELIARMINDGHIVGNHSVTHPDFSTLSEKQIIDEIKGFDDYIRKNFGYSALYFRFPQGKYSEYALSAVNNLGYKCVFWSLAYADWDTSAQKGAEYAKDTVMSRIHPGAVILLHSVSSDNAQALGDIIDSCIEKGYEFHSLTEL